MAFFAALGSTLASVALYLTFITWDRTCYSNGIPTFAKSKAWADATRWLYGSSALFVVIAFPLPVPKVPAVLVAIGRGKLLKYTVYALIVSRFPERFADLYGRLAEQRPHRAVGEPADAEPRLSVTSVQK